jgi:RNA polymerase sigma-70 factor (ECF subfamily)
LEAALVLERERPDEASRKRVGGGRSRTISRTFCLVPARLEASLFDLLERHFAEDPQVSVIVDRRGAERRGQSRRTDALGGLPADGDRRRVRSQTGRRMFDRRGVAVTIDPRPLPRRARSHASEIVFVDCIEQTGDRLKDAEAARLVASFQSGDVSAFTTLYERYFDGVWGYLRLLLRDHHEAEDAAQQTFTKAFEALPTFELRLGTPFRSWLYRIARNEALNHLRKHKRVAIEEPDRVALRCEASVPEMPHDMLGWLSDSELLVFMERLPASQRQALALRYIVGLRTEELAEVLGRSPQAVRKLEHRALRFLEERMTTSRTRAGAKLQRVGMLVRLRRLPVLGARRFSLGPSGRARQSW